MCALSSVYIPSHAPIRRNDDNEDLEEHETLTQTENQDGVAPQEEQVQEESLVPQVVAGSENGEVARGETEVAEPIEIVDTLVETDSQEELEDEDFQETVTGEITPSQSAIPEIQQPEVILQPLAAETHPPEELLARELEQEGIVNDPVDLDTDVSLLQQEVEPQATNTTEGEPMITQTQEEIDIDVSAIEQIRESPEEQEECDTTEGTDQNPSTPQDDKETSVLENKQEDTPVSVTNTRSKRRSSLQTSQSRYSSLPKYNPGDVVWVKVRTLWWPAQVISLEELPSEVVRPKDIPYATVAFFTDDSYEFVLNPRYIEKYDSPRKNEFLQRGMNYFESNMHEKSYMFPDDVAIAESKTNGNPNILHVGNFQKKEKKRPVYEGLFGDPKKKPKTSLGSKRGRTPKTDPPKRSFNSEHSKRLFNLSLSKNPGYKANILPQEKIFKVEPVTPTTAYNCHQCSFTTSRINTLIIHNKTHIKPPSPTKDSKKSTKKYEKSQTKRTPQKAAQKTVQNGETVTKTEPKTVTPNVKRKLLTEEEVVSKKKKNTEVKVNKKKKESKEKPAAEIHDSLLQDWLDDADDGDMDASSENISVGTNPGTSGLNNSKTNKGNEEKSCFDFEDNDEELNINNGRMLFGKKLPRLFGKKEKSKNEIDNDEEETEVQYEDKIEKEDESTAHEGDKLVNDIDNIIMDSQDNLIYENDQGNNSGDSLPDSANDTIKDTEEDVSSTTEHVTENENESCNVVEAKVEESHLDSKEMEDYNTKLEQLLNETKMAPLPEIALISYYESSESAEKTVVVSEECEQIEHETTSLSDPGITEEVVEEQCEPETSEDQSCNNLYPEEQILEPTDGVVDDYVEEEHADGVVEDYAEEEPADGVEEEHADCVVDDYVEEEHTDGVVDDYSDEEHTDEVVDDYIEEEHTDGVVEEYVDEVLPCDVTEEVIEQEVTEDFDTTEISQDLSSNILSEIPKEKNIECDLSQGFEEVIETVEDERMTDVKGGENGIVNAINVNSITTFQESNTDKNDAARSTVQDNIMNEFEDDDDNDNTELKKEIDQIVSRPENSLQELDPFNAKLALLKFASDSKARKEMYGFNPMESEGKVKEKRKAGTSIGEHKSMKCAKVRVEPELLKFEAPRNAPTQTLSQKGNKDPTPPTRRVKIETVPKIVSVKDEPQHFTMVSNKPVRNKPIQTISNRSRIPSLLPTKVEPTIINKDIKLPTRQVVTIKDPKTGALTKYVLTAEQQKLLQERTASQQVTAHPSSRQHEPPPKQNRAAKPRKEKPATGSARTRLPKQYKEPNKQLKKPKVARGVSSDVSVFPVSTSDICAPKSQRSVIQLGSSSNTDSGTSRLTTIHHTTSLHGLSTIPMVEETIIEESVISDPSQNIVMLQQDDDQQVIYTIASDNPDEIGQSIELGDGTILASNDDNVMYLTTEDGQIYQPLLDNGQLILETDGQNVYYDSSQSLLNMQCEVVSSKSDLLARALEDTGMSIPGNAFSNDLLEMYSVQQYKTSETNVTLNKSSGMALHGTTSSQMMSPTISSVEEALMEDDIEYEYTN